MRTSLQTENETLRRELDSLLNEARRNEEKMRRFDRLERRLIGTRSLSELLHLVLADYRSEFELDTVSLVILDPAYEVARILEGQGEAATWPGLLLQEEGFLLENFFLGDFSPRLAAFDAGQHASLFSPQEMPPTSVALLPLCCQGRLVGSLNLGSRAPERFSAGSGTEFLSRLAAIVAVCLDGAINHERLKLVGLTDPLTGVNNRRYFERRCEEEITRARRHAQPLSCMFIDIDRFKRINDTLGHQSGDEVLRQVAASVKGQLRGCDVLARYGGEEFVILLPQTAIRHACDIAERIRARVAARPIRTPAGQNLLVTVSIGVSALLEGAGDADCSLLAGRLIEEADKALYQAKEGGRNRVVSEHALAPGSSDWPMAGRWVQCLSNLLRLDRILSRLTALRQ